MRFVQKCSAVLLLVLWPALTSHTLLEQLHLIHVVHDDHHGEGGSHEHNADNHQFADGDYTITSTKIALNKPSFVKAHGLLAEFVIAAASISDEVPGPAPPPLLKTLGLAASWQFQYRTALPVRAPSFLL
jgi:hypothetical protein